MGIFQSEHFVLSWPVSPLELLYLSYFLVSWSGSGLSFKRKSPAPACSTSTEGLLTISIIAEFDVIFEFQYSTLSLPVSCSELEYFIVVSSFVVRIEVVV